MTGRGVSVMAARGGLDIGMLGARSVPDTEVVALKLQCPSGQTACMCRSH